MKVRIQYKHKARWCPNDGAEWVDNLPVDEYGFYEVKTKLCSRCWCEAHVISRMLVSA